MLTEQVMICFTPEQRQKVFEYARSQGLTASQWLRKITLQLIREQDLKDGNRK